MDKLSIKEAERLQETDRFVSGLTSNSSDLMTSIGRFSIVSKEQSLALVSGVDQVGT